MDGETHKRPYANAGNAGMMTGIPRTTAASLNPLICQVSGHGTMLNVADLVEAIGYAVDHEETADDLAPQFWRIALLMKSALLYEAAAMQ